MQMLSASFPCISLAPDSLARVFDYDGCDKAAEDNADEDVGPC